MKIATERGVATRDQVHRQLVGVEAIEIKVTIPEAQIEAAMGLCGLTVDNDEERYIYFFDTPDLTLFKGGIIARARRIVGDEHDSTVKFRPVVPNEIPGSWQAFKGFKLEADASEKGVTKSASLTMPVPKGMIKKVIAGEKGISRLFTSDQERFLSSLSTQHVDYDALSVLGPLQAHRWKFTDSGCPWPITAELWKREDGARLMEVSIKTPVVQAAVGIAGFMAFLAEVGAERDVEQQSKTRWALMHHTKLARKSAKAAA